MIAALSVKLSKKLRNGFEVSFEAKGVGLMALVVAVTSCLAGLGVCGGFRSNRRRAIGCAKIIGKNALRFDFSDPRQVTEYTRSGISR